MKYVMNNKQSQIMGMIMSGLLFAAMILVARETAQLVTAWKEQESTLMQKCIVIDAGHGGIDPGKVGINNALEKDINLAIAIKVKRYLELQDIEVIMTRQDDNGLYQESDSNKKVCDMKARLKLIEDSQPLLAVSIHQNSYPEESVNGVQVFYYKDSVQGEKAALLMQEQMIQTLKPKKERTAKENGSYYLLKKTSVPIIIIECGFLSNQNEAQLLTTEEYQNQVAWAIHMGILRFINQ